MDLVFRMLQVVMEVQEEVIQVMVAEDLNIPIILEVMVVQVLLLFVINIKINLHPIFKWV